MVKVILWSLMSIFCIDVSISYLIEPPKNNSRPGALSKYFDYGLSIESKLFRLVGENDTKAASISKAGWFTPLDDTNNSTPKKNQKKRVIIYGMSFSNHIGHIISQQDETLDIKLFAGPAAPLNHSYAYYQQHRPHQQGDVVILGILASSIPRINSLSHMTANFESPAAHFYPRYRLDSKNQVVKKQIEIDSLAELRQVIHNENEWNQVKQILEEEDSFYNPLLFSKTLADKSTYAKLLKRAWGQKHAFEMTQRYHDNNGFKNSDRLIELSQALVEDFILQVRNDNAIPYLILFNDRGFSDHLYLMLKPVLEQYDIPFYSTHNNFPATQLSNFIPDGHFTPAIDKAIAKSVLKEINILNWGRDK